MFRVVKSYDILIECGNLDRQIKQGTRVKRGTSKISRQQSPAEPTENKITK